MLSERQKEPAATADPMDELLGYHLRRLSVAAMADLAEALKPLDLSPTTASLLFLVGANPGITQSDAGKLLGVLRANMAPLVAGLAKRGLLDRERRDGRSHGLRLSAAGRILQCSAWKATLAHEERVFGALPAVQRSRMIGLLRPLWKGERT